MLTAVHSQPNISIPLARRIQRPPKFRTPRSLLDRTIRSSFIRLARQIIEEEQRIIPKRERGGGGGGGEKRERGRSRPRPRPRPRQEKMMLLLVQCLLGGIVASLLGFLLLSRSRSNSEKRNGSERVRGQCRSDSAGGDGGPDVVIVGAGVAGAALACTLGKVLPFPILL